MLDTLSLVLKATLTFVLVVDVASGDPTGEQTISGWPTFIRGDDTLTVTQTSNKAIINWQAFSI